ncbi:MAG: hypothetical protein HQK86_02740 [Nitrospinae bacterium]|nr:hypothetical protein [Nitrospinota bacterium]MBF0635117.1 hypothetical protein [Nitrospinota bacterium]
MSKFLAGVFVGAFAGALAYEVAKRVYPKAFDRFDGVIDLIANYASSLPGGGKRSALASPGMDRIPIQ